MKTLCYLVERLGPYHVARLNQTAVSTGLDIHALELAPLSETYAWTTDGAEGRAAFTRHSLPGRRNARALSRLLDGIKPATVFLNGWADWGAFQGLAWCLKNNVPAGLMSDSQERDEPRVAWKEAVKRRFVGHCQAAFVAGQRHVEYAMRLGMSAQQVVTGYDVVDNDHFRSGAAAARADAAGWKERLKLPKQHPYFLCVSRFVPKKNLPLLLRAYRSYRRRMSTQHAEKNLWDLVVLGDGVGKEVLQDQIEADHLSEHVHLHGFQQYDELPAYYGLAGALVLASTTDQWGLAVNEAMAAGLPVLVSSACGCMPELVHEGMNGYTFEPTDESALIDSLLKIASAHPDTLSAMGAASQRIIADWSLSRFAEGVRQAFQLATSGQRTRHRLRDFIGYAAFRGLAYLR